MFKKKYQIEVNEQEYNIIINTLNEYRNKFKFRFFAKIFY